VRTRTIAAVGAAAVVLGGASAVALNNVTSESVAVTTAEPKNCEDWNITLSDGECFAAGIIRNVSLYNLQGAAQFCKWKGANPGEWSRLKGYAATETEPLNIITWMGGHIKNDIQAYFVTGAPTFTIQPNTAPNACTGKLVTPPVVTSVTPGETDVTVTVTTTP